MPPEEKQGKEVYISKIKSRLDKLSQLREANDLAGKAESAEDTSEIACLKHMLFVAQTPPAGLLPATWARVTALEQQLEGVLAQEKEIQAKRQALQASARHFRQIYEELKEEFEERERELPLDERTEEMGREEGEGEPSRSHSSPFAPSFGQQADYGLQSLPHHLGSPYPGEEQGWTSGGKGYGGHSHSQGWGDGSYGWGKGWSCPNTNLEHRFEELSSTVGSLVEALRFQQFTQCRPAADERTEDVNGSETEAQAHDGGARERSPEYGLYEDATDIIPGYGPTPPTRHKGSTPYPEETTCQRIGNASGSQVSATPASGTDVGSPSGN